jgi:translation initiation factor IF-2
LPEEKRFKSRGDPAEEAITTQYQNCREPKLTGRLICLSLINRKKKKKSLKLLNKPSGAAGERLIRINERIALNRVRTLRPPRVLENLIPISVCETLENFKVKKEVSLKRLSRRDKRDTHRQKSDDEQRVDEEANY